MVNGVRRFAVEEEIFASVAFQDINSDGIDDVFIGGRYVSFMQTDEWANAREFLIDLQRKLLIVVGSIFTLLNGFQIRILTVCLIY